MPLSDRMKDDTNNESSRGSQKEIDSPGEGGQKKGPPTPSGGNLDSSGDAVNERTRHEAGRKTARGNLDSSVDALFERTRHASTSSLSGSNPRGNARKCPKNFEEVSLLKTSGLTADDSPPSSHVKAGRKTPRNDLAHVDSVSRPKRAKKGGRKGIVNQRGNVDALATAEDDQKSASWTLPAKNS